MDRQYNFKETRVCRRCKGEGITITEGIHLGHGKYSDPEENVCTLCGGTGLVQVEKNIDVFITPKTPKPYAKE